VTVAINREKAAKPRGHVADIAATLRLLVAHESVDLQEKGRNTKCTCVQKAFRTNLAGLSLMTFRRPDWGRCLADVVDLDRSMGPSEVNRPEPPSSVDAAGQRRARYRKARVAEGLTKIFDDLEMPAGYTAQPVDGRRRWRAQHSAFSSRSRVFIFMYLVCRTTRIWLHRSRFFSASLTVAVRAGVAAHLPSVPQHLLDARHPGAIRRRQKKIDPAIDHTTTEGRGMGRLEAILAGNKDRLRPTS